MFITAGLSAAFYVLKNVALWFAFVAIKKYIIIALLALAGFWALKGTYFMGKFLEIIFGTTGGRLVFTALLAFGLGGVLGWNHHRTNNKVHYENVQKRDGKLRSKAIVKDGKTYYPQTMINKYLKHKKVDGNFKNLA